MSKAAEEAHERWSVQHDAECARNFTVGAKVYRPAKYADRGIDEGTVTQIGRCYFDRWASHRRTELQDGESAPAGCKVYTLYVAKFPRFGQPYYESQTCESEFYADPRHAHMKRAILTQREIDNVEHRLKKMREDHVASVAAADGVKMEWRW